MTWPELLRLLEEEVEIRSKIRGDLVAWASEALRSDDQSPAAHHRLLLKELTALSRGDTDRLLVHMPPGSAKSTYASTFFPIWWLGQNPGGSIIAASHTSRLAESFSRRIRNLIVEHRARLGLDFRPSDRSIANWRLTNGGEYLAIGTRGAISGRRADLVIVDDPIGSMAQVMQARERDRLWDWYRADLSTRLKPNGRVLIVMTRWHEDDIAARLAGTGSWRVLSLPALAEDNDPLGRPPGAPLWPEWEGLDRLRKRRLEVGERVWAASYQQSPVPPEGALFAADRLFVDDGNVGPDPIAVRAWDFAATTIAESRDPDWTVGIKLCRPTPDRFVILDVVRLRGTPLQVQHTLVATARADGKNVRIDLPQDPGSAGKILSRQYTGLLSGYRVKSSTETGNKAIRAMPLVSQIEAGNVGYVRAPWNAALIAELRDFPHGSHDDQVDALVRAYNALDDEPEPTRSDFNHHFIR